MFIRWFNDSALETFRVLPQTNLPSNFFFRLVFFWQWRVTWLRLLKQRLLGFSINRVFLVFALIWRIVGVVIIWFLGYMTRHHIFFDTSPAIDHLRALLKLYLIIREGFLSGLRVSTHNLWVQCSVLKLLQLLAIMKNLLFLRETRVY